MSTNESRNLLLLAEQYLSGELDNVQLAEFEQNLATDFATQSVLADVVMIRAALGQTSITDTSVDEATDVARAESSTIRKADTSPQHRWNSTRILQVVPVAAAVLLLGALGLISPVTSTDLSALPGQALGFVGGEELVTVELWSELAAEAEGLETELEPEVAKDDHSDIAAEVVDVPEWMFAAVEAELMATQSDNRPFRQRAGTL